MAAFPDAAVTAQTADTEDALEEVQVSGERPGPGLWQVRKGDNSLWILGTHSPLPQKIQWRSKRVEQIIAESASVIAPASVTVGVGTWQGLRLMPAVLRARAIPEGKTLQQVLSPPLYARWSKLQQRYLASHKKVQRWRPVFAGGELFEQALQQSGLRARNVVWPTIERLAKQHNVPIRRPMIALPLEDPRALIRDFSQTDVSGELACFEALMAAVEQDLPELVLQAEAWAVGDIEPLRGVKQRTREERCLSIIMSAPRLAKLMEDAEQRSRREWLLAVEGALLRQKTTLAVVPIRELLAPEGLLMQQRGLGYEVVEP